MIAEIENALLAENIPRFWCGTDEAGRGPLAGPVTAAAVVFEPDAKIPENLNDSKQLTEKQRDRLFDEIQACAKAFAITDISPQTIDEINILQASLLAMKQSVLKITEYVGGEKAIGMVMIDGNKLIPDFCLPQQCYVKGDARSYHIAAASILAKVHRDRIMDEMDARYPGYGFAKHKGYPTKAHREAILRLGPSPIHRLTFNGVIPQQRELF